MASFGKAVRIVQQGAPARLWLVALTAVGVLAVASLAAGVPKQLPSVALGAAWLLHLERVATGAMAVSVVIAIAIRGAHGQLPLKLGTTSIEFESLKASAAEGLDDLEIELKALRRRIDRLEQEG